MRIPPQRLARRRISPLISMLSVAALSLVAAPAWAVPAVALDADPPPAGAGCPDAGALRADLRALLGRDPFDAMAPRRFVVRWRVTPRGLAVELAVVEGGAVRGARRLESEAGECAALHRAVGLMLALALDPLRLAEPLPAGVSEARGAGRQGDAGAAGDGMAGGEAAGDGRSGDGMVGGGTSGDGTPGDGTPGDGTPGDGTPGDGTPGDGTPGDGTPGDGTSGDGTPGDGTTGNGMASDGTPDNGTPDNGTPDNGMASDGTPGDGTPGDGMASDGTPGNGMASDGTPGDGTPGDGTPGDGTPGDGTPGDGSPAPVEGAAAGRVWRVEPAVGVLAMAGATPGVSGGAAVGVDVRGRWFGAGAELRGVWPSATGFAGGEVRAGLLGMGLRGCGYGGRFGGCAVALGGWQRSSGAGFARNAVLDAPYLAVGGRVMVAFAVGDGWWLRPVVEVLVPLTATRSTVGGVTAWETSAVNGALGLEVGWR